MRYKFRPRFLNSCLLSSFVDCLNYFSGAFKMKNIYIGDLLSNQKIQNFEMFSYSLSRILCSCEQTLCENAKNFIDTIVYSYMGR